MYVYSRLRPKSQWGQVGEIPRNSLPYPTHEKVTDVLFLLGKPYD